MCFLAATTFWFLNALNKDYTTRLLYPIAFDYADTAYIATAKLPEKIFLNVSGYGWNLLRKSIIPGSKPLVIKINSPARTHYLTGINLLPAVTEQLDDIRVNYIMDDTLFVSFDRKISKAITLRVDSTQLPLKENYRLTSPVSIEPATITFTGPASIVGTLSNEIYIDIPVKEIDENYDESLPVDYVQNELVTKDAQWIRVSFEVAPFISEVQRVPVQTANFPKKNSPALPSPEAEVQYLVPQDDAGKARLQDFQVIADFKTFNKKDSSVKLSVVTHPDFVREVRPVYGTVKLRYEQK